MTREILESPSSLAAPHGGSDARPSPADPEGRDVDSREAAAPPQRPSLILTIDQLRNL